MPYEIWGTGMDGQYEPFSQQIPFGQAASNDPQTEMILDERNADLNVEVENNPNTKDTDPAEAIEDSVIEEYPSALDTHTGSVPSSPETEDDDSYEDSEDEVPEQASPIQSRGFLPIAPREPSQHAWLMDGTPPASPPKWPNFGQTVQNWLMTDNGGRKVTPRLVANTRLNIDVEFDHKLNAYVIYRRNNISVENIECHLFVPDFCHATEPLWIQQTDQSAKIPIKEFSLRLRSQFLHEKREPSLLQLVGSRPMIPEKVPKDIEIDPQWAIMETDTDIELPKYAAKVAFHPGSHSAPARFTRIQFGESTRKNRKNSRKQQDLVCLKVQLIARVEDRVAIVSEICSPYLMVRGKCPIFHSETRTARVRKRCQDNSRRAQSSKDLSVPVISQSTLDMMGWRNIAPRLPEN